ncbi:protein THEM6-like [Danaus plexippus]|uniref:protein THEM6-like n=1 Tax=Danaus plexippus TaxID=13037 RepID=UPI002AAF1C49|nr:protein THEM6-like [Danaus plexippus]
MIFLCILCFITIIYMFSDINYGIRTLFTVLSGRLCEKSCSLADVTVIYGMCTFKECKLTFNSMRVDRLIRDIDFGKYHFYDRTGIYKRSRLLGIHSLQGSTLILREEDMPIFVPYKINTKLVFWDERSFFFEHEVITVHDGKVRYLFVSRQYAMGKNTNNIKDLIKGLPGSECEPDCPNYISKWLQSMEMSSKKINRI